VNILFILVPLALLLGIFFLANFLWANKNGQFDDLDTPALKILNEDKSDKRESSHE